MERLGALISKLQEQYQQNAGTASIALTAQMILAELQQQKSNINNPAGKISVVMPKANVGAILNGREEVTEQTSPAVTEAKQNGAQQKKQENFGWKFDPMQEVPTLAHQNKELFELNEAMAQDKESLNEKLRIEKKELGNVLQEIPVRDLKKAIGINDRFLFINDLFRGDETMYERSIKTINSFNILPEAEYWIQRELKLKLAWSEDSETVLLFDQLVKRRFS